MGSAAIFLVRRLLGYNRYERTAMTLVGYFFPLPNHRICESRTTKEG